jgi:two-component system, cell cycle response regulator CtrA
VPGQLSILVAEDDGAFAGSLRSLLEQDGHTVSVAEHGYQALELARAERFDVLLLDVVMPGLTGDEVARQVWLARPDLPVAFMTGDYGLDLVEDLAAPILRKPFRDRELLELIRTLSASSTDQLDSPSALS